MCFLPFIQSDLDDEEKFGVYANMFRLFMHNFMSTPITDALLQSDTTLMLVNFGKITKLYIALYSCSNGCFIKLYFIRSCMAIKIL